MSAVSSSVVAAGTEKVIVDPVHALFTAQRSVPLAGAVKLSAAVLLTTGLVTHAVLVTLNVTLPVLSVAVTLNVPAVSLAVNWGVIA